jgi:hypothetical protein
MRLPAFASRRRVLAGALALVLALAVLAAVLPYVGGGRHGISPLP